MMNLRRELLGMPWILGIAVSSLVEVCSYGQGVDEAVGVTAPVKDATLSSTVAGTILRVRVEEGDRVKKGDVLLELESELEVLEVARRKLTWESKAEVESAGDRVKTVEMDLEGTRKLFESTQSVSREELEQKELEYKLSVAEWKRLQTAEAREEIEYKMALESLKHRQIISPMNGALTKVFLEEGENCEPRQPLVRVVDTTRCHFVCNVDAQIAARLVVGQKVQLAVESGSSMVDRTGTIIFISSVVDPASGLQEVKAEFDNLDGTIRPGVGGILRLKR